MDSDKIVEELLRNLSFEIDTAAQNNPFRLKHISKSIPLNIKVRVRKKNQTQQYGIISIPKTCMTNDKIRLANSDQTVMSFDLFMEPDLQKKPTKKHRKRLMEIIRQGTCLGTQENDEDICYLPSSSYKQTLKGQSVTSKSDCSLNQPTTLSKQHYLNSSSTLPKTNNFLGKCKPGGCLDPPYREDKYPYTPAKELLMPAQLPMNIVINTVKCDNSSIKTKTENTNFSAVDMSIANDPKETNVILKLYEAGSINTSFSTTHSNSIITYPPTLTFSDCHIENGNNMNSSIFTEINKNTADQVCNAYFTPPKEVLKCHDKKESEITNLYVSNNTDMSNKDTLDYNSAQYGMKKPTDLSQSTYIDTIPNENNINNNIDSVKLHQQYENGAMWKISHSQLEINKVKKSEPITPNEYLLVQNHNSSEHDAFQYNDTKLDFLNETDEFQGLHKLEDIDLSRQSDQQILQTKSHSFDTFKYLNSNITSEILAGLGHNVQINIYEKDTIILNKSLTNTNAVNKDFDESGENVIQQLSNDLNTTITKHSEITLYNKPVTEFLYNASTSLESFMLRTKECSTQNLPEASLKLTEFNNLNDKNRKKNVTGHLYTESQKYDEKNILSEKVDDDIVSHIIMEETKSNDKSNVSSGDTIIDATNLNVENKIKSLTNKRSTDTIHSISHSKKKSISLLKDDEFLIQKCHLNDNYSNNLEYVPDVQIATYISKIYLNKEEERFLQDNSNMDVVKPTEEENVIKQLSTNVYVSTMQELGTVPFPHNSRAKNLKQEAINNIVLMDIKKQNSSHNQILLGEEGTAKGSASPVHNYEKNETEKLSLLTSTLPGKDALLNMNKLSKSHSQLIPLADFFPLSVIQPHEVTNGIHKQNTTIKATSRLFEIDKLSDQKPNVRNTSLIYGDTQLINQNLTLLADNITNEINIDSDADVKNNTDNSNLQKLGTQKQNIYPDPNKVELPKPNLTTISHNSLIPFKNISTANYKKNDLYIDMALSDHKPIIRNTSRIYADQQLINKNSTLSAEKIKDELNVDSDPGVQNNTDTSDLQGLGTQIQNVHSDENKVELPKHNLTYTSHSMLMQSENILTVNDKKNDLSLALSNHETVIRSISRTYVDKLLVDKDSTLSTNNIKNELIAIVNNKKNVPSLHMALSDNESIIRNTSQIYTDIQLVDTNFTYSEDLIKYDLYINSNDTVHNNTDTSNLQELGTQVQDVYSDMNKVETPKSNLKRSSPSSPMQSKNILTANNEKNKLSVNVPLFIHEPVIRNTSRIYADKQLINKDSTLSADKIKGKLDIDTDADVLNNIDTSDLQGLGTQIQNVHSDADTLELPKPYMKTISHSSPIQSENTLIANDMKNDLFLDFAFQMYTNDTNQRFLRSFSSQYEPKRHTGDTLFTLKTDIQTNIYKLIIPIDTKTKLSIHINKINDRIEMLQSTISKGTQVTEPIKLLNNAESVERQNELGSYFLSIWEKEFMPLQMAIKGLKNEIDSLVKEQFIIKNNIHDVKKTKLIRVSNVGRQCGCIKGFY